MGEGQFLTPDQGAESNGLFAPAVRDSKVAGVRERTVLSIIAFL
jgi:hypothetical protein